MLAGILFIVSIVILLAGCAVLFLDVVVSLKTDRCVVSTPAEYVRRSGELDKAEDRPGRFMVIAVPEFRYVFEGKKYQGKSSNVFFHLYLGPGRLQVPFVEGKTYEVFVNPASPTMFISSGEQRFPFLRALGCFVVLIGLGLIYLSMHL